MFMSPVKTQTEAAIADEDLGLVATNIFAIRRYNSHVSFSLQTTDMQRYDLVARVVVCVEGQAQTLQRPRIRIELRTMVSNQGKALNTRLSIGTGDEGKLGRATLGNLLFLDT